MENIEQKQNADSLSAARDIRYQLQRAVNCNTAIKNAEEVAGDDIVIALIENGTFGFSVDKQDFIKFLKKQKMKAFAKTCVFREQSLKNDEK
jgi:hypothetical protein